MQRSDEEWEELAIAWRRAAEMDDVTRLDAPAFVRWLKHSGRIKDYVCVPDGDLPGAKGKYEPEEERVYYRNSTWRDALRGDPPAVFALVHEGCHSIFKHKETRLRAASPLRRMLGSNQDEIDTNRLTVCILAPFHKADFKLGMTAADIAGKFGLSLPAAERRLKEFEGLYRRKHGISRDLPQGVYDFLLAQKLKGHKVTSISDSALPARPIKRYEGDVCPNCTEFKLYRLGLNMKCSGCGAITGED